MSCAHLTDQDIEALCAGKPYADRMRSDLRAQRYRDQVEQQGLRRRERAAQEEACRQAEEAMTDAGKADDFPPHASPFPTEAQARNVKLSLAVSGDKMVGKTSLLLFLLEAMADAGMLPVADTKTITLDPMRFLSAKRVSNEENVEVIDLDLDLNEAIDQMILKRAAPVEQPMPLVLEAVFEVDALLTQMTGWEKYVRASINELCNLSKLDEADEIVIRFHKT